MFEMMIVDSDDLPVPPGEVGECLVRARYPWRASSGYYNQPEETARSRLNEWFHTGDRGYLDEDNYFWFVGRAKDAIRRRGENISAFEVEQFIADHPAVAEIAAYPLKADESEEEMAISIVVAKDQALAPSYLLRFCIATMPRYMVPRFIHQTDALPRNLSTRVEKYKLIGWAEENRTSLWDSMSLPEFRNKNGGVAVREGLQP